MALRPLPRAELPADGFDEDELPVSDGVPMDSEQDAINARLYLCEPLKGWSHEHDRTMFVGSNSFVYYDESLPPVGPDFYAVNDGVQGDKEMWVAWRENGRLPTLVIEFLSKSTARVDRGKKFKIYRDRFRCLDYIMCRRTKGVLEGYRLRQGVYVPTRPDRNGRLRLGSLPLLVGFHEGRLRFFNLDGSLVRTDAERAEDERKRADEAVALATAERLRAEQALEELRALRASMEGKGQ